MAREIWNVADLPSYDINADLSLYEKLKDIFGMMSDATINIERRRTIPWMLWTIWKNRNSIMFAKTQESVLTQIERVIEDHTIWMKGNLLQERTNLAPRDIGLLRVWSPLIAGQVKCNVHANWRNAKLHCGGAWITRDVHGIVKHHAREAFTCSHDRFTAKMRCLLWVLQSLKDLSVQEIIIGSDCKELVEAMKRPNDWPRYLWLLHQIITISAEFRMVGFEVESVSSNQIAREIARTVLQNGRFQSYLALRGPAWLHDRICREIPTQ